MSLEQKITDAVNTYITAFENEDLDAIMGIYADDCSVEDPVGSPVKQGRAAVQEFYEGAIKMKVKLQLEGQIRIAGNEAAFAFSGEVDTGDGIMTFNPIDVMVFNDEGKVTSMRAFFGPTNSGMKS
jgi:steroid delta-isomerase